MLKSTLGIIGGGQLGSLLASAAKKIDIKTVIFSDDTTAPARNFCDEFLYGDYTDQNKVDEFVNKVDVVTYEFENIPYETLNHIKNLKNVLPDPEINKIVQNRFTEKNFLNKFNIKTTSYVLIKNISDLELNLNLIPGILKTCTLGYDGKGQQKINNLKNVDNIIIDTDKKYILERLVQLKKEISVIITRFGNQEHEIYEPIENTHEDQILRYSKIPAQISDELIIKSKKWATLIAEELNYIGTLCVEYFIDKDDNLYVNEIAPRVHNSGHLTINSHNVSQFENHVRAVCGLKKIETKKLYNAKMINIIGNDILSYKNKKFKGNEFFYNYLKKEIKPKRKMGHVTTIDK